jgi:hypothetical protein
MKWNNLEWLAMVLLVPIAMPAASRESFISVERILPSKDQTIALQRSPFRYRGALSLDSKESGFGGYSGLWVDSDGVKLAAVEGGKWLEASLVYDRAGNLSGMKVTGSGALLDADGNPLSREEDQDAEALSFDGHRYLVAFEDHHRVVVYPTFRSPAINLELPPQAVAGVPRETGFSSVVALPGGSVLALHESTPDELNGPQTHASKTRGWLMTKEGAGFIWLRESSYALPLDLAAFPNGDLLLLELLIPPSVEVTQTRASRIAASEIRMGATMRAEQLAVLQPSLISADVQGAAIRRGSKGEKLIYLISNSKPCTLYMLELKSK